jgi:hypothetical protein
LGVHHKALAWCFNLPVLKFGCILQLFSLKMNVIAGGDRRR